MKEKFIKLRFEKGEDYFEMGNDCPVKLITLPTGLESPGYLVHTSSNANADGVSITGKKVDSRQISISFAIDDLENAEIYRAQMIRFFNPKESLKCIVQYGAMIRHINCEIQEFIFESQVTLWDYLAGSINLLCADPYFKDMDNFGKNIAANTAMFSFPFFIPAQGRIASYKTLRKEVLLRNQGDVPTGVEIHIIADRGSVTNPVVTKVSTGEFMKFDLVMAMGDVVIINTNPGKKSITYNGVNFFKEKSKLSSFFSIDVGDNILSYDADKNYTNLDVRLYYIPQYMGV